MKKAKETYKGAGVDTDAGNKAVELIAAEVKKTYPLLSTGEVISTLGGFSSLVELPSGQIVATTTDGVGTKLVLAILLNKHETVGIDLVAMCVNDLLTGGITTGVFLDYIVQGKQTPKKSEEIVKGIIEGCKLSGGYALVGGEMAECPSLYEIDCYDLAGFAVGFAESRRQLVMGNGIVEGMNVYGLPSSGLHSNGFSLVRKIFKVFLETPKFSKKALEEYYSELGCTLGEELLTPTEIYVKEVKTLMSKFNITGMVNITGGGLVENPIRVLPKNTAMKIDMRTWDPHSIFELVQKLGGVSTMEMLKATNYGIGFLLISGDEIKQPGVIKIGEIIRKKGDPKVYFEGKSDVF